MSRHVHIPAALFRYMCKQTLAPHEREILVSFLRKEAIIFHREGDDLWDRHKDIATGKHETAALITKLANEVEGTHLTASGNG